MKKLSLTQVRNVLGSIMVLCLYLQSVPTYAVAALADAVIVNDVVALDVGVPFQSLAVKPSSYSFWDDDNAYSLEQMLGDAQSYLDDGSLPSYWGPQIQGIRTFSHPPMWAVFIVENSSSNAENIALRSRYVISKEVQVTIVGSAGLEQSFLFGSSYPYASKPIEHRWSVVPFSLEAGERKAVLVKIQGSAGVFLSVTEIIPELSVLKDDVGRVLFDGVFLGFAAFFFVAGFLAWLIIKKAIFFYYCLGLLSTILFLLSNLGYGAQYLWTDNTWISSRIYALSVTMMPAAQAMFAYYFLRLKRAGYTKTRLFNVAVSWLCIMCFVIELFVEPINALIIAMWLLLPLGLVMILNVIASARLWSDGFPAGKFYTIVCGFYFILLGFSAFSGVLGLEVPVENIFPHVVYIFVSAVLFGSLVKHVADLRIASDRATAESRAKTQFLAKMSHEIRTPMNGVLGMTELLKDTRLTKTQRHYLDVIHSSGRSLLTVINEILDYSKITSGKIDLETIKFNIAELLEDCVSLFSAQARKKQLEVVCRVQPSMPRNWNGDQAKIRQVLTNLIGNAMKFTDAGDVKIDASVGVDGDLVIAISDTGIGVEESKIGELFQDFSQADVSTSRKYGGTGLGLTICKQLVELMGGSIEVESLFGAGTTFTVIIPLSSFPNEEAESIPANICSKRVLLVDDNIAYRRVAVEALKDCFCEVIEAVNGVDALSKIRAEESVGGAFDLISIDIEMPEMDGIELAKELHREGLARASAILFLSASDNLPSADSCLSWGVYGSARKPVLTDELIVIYIRAITGVVDGESDKSDVPSREIAEDKLHILVAEDNDVNFMVVSAMLNKMGHEVQRAKNGLIAVELFKSNNINRHAHSFDLIFMDCEMPEMDGFESTKTIRSLEKGRAGKIKIVALTAHAVKELLNKCIEVGMDEVVSKPFTRDKLIEALSL